MFDANDGTDPSPLENFDMGDLDAVGGDAPAPPPAAAVEEKAPIAPPEPPVTVPSEPVGAAPQETTPTPEQPEPALDPAEQLRRDNESLREELTRLSTEMVQRANAPQQPTMPQQPLAPYSFVRDKESFDRMLSDAIDKGDYREWNSMLMKPVELALRAVPTVVEPIVQEAVMQTLSTQLFWLRNQDLVEHKEYLAAVANSLQATDPTKSFDEITGAAAQHVRTKLGLAPGRQTPVVPTTQPSRVVPAVAPAPSARTVPVGQPKNLSPMEQELAELDALFGV